MALRNLVNDDSVSTPPELIQVVVNGQGVAAAVRTQQSGSAYLKLP